MPTGYTNGVMEGTVTSFKEYALLCARAFGAFTRLRDEPLSVEVPVIKPSSHYAENLARLRKELEEFQSMNDEDKRALYGKECEQQAKQAAEQINKKRMQRERCEAMLAKARKFKPPTEKHEAYSKFLITQLEESIDFDCDETYWLGQLDLPYYDDWVASKVDDITRSIEFYAEENKKEESRVQDSNQWIRELVDAINSVEERIEQ